MGTQRVNVGNHATFSSNHREDVVIDYFQDALKARLNYNACLHTTATSSE